MHPTRHHLVLLAQWMLLGIVALAFVLVFSKPIVLTASDMGRHLMNGKLFLDHGIITTTNTYSYTFPDYPFLNHHWGSGVLFELARRLWGFTGVAMLGVSVVFLTTLLYLRIAWKIGTLWLTVMVAIIVLPVFAGRAEVRPELWSYLGSAIFLWILLGVRSGSLSPRALLALPPLMLVWVNLHIYFFLGIGWIGAFLMEALVHAWWLPEQRSLHLRRAGALAAALAGACLLTVFNPNGWRGAVYPLFIFQDYAYAVAENQSVIRIERNDPFPPAFFMKIAIAIFILSWLLRLGRDYRNRELPDIALLILSIFVGIIGWNAIRNFTIFSYVALIALSMVWSDIDWRKRLGRLATPVAIILPLCTLLTIGGIYPTYWKLVYQTIGLGVSPTIMGSIDFFKENNLHGPIFNNYDIGSFLTYGLYPQERVFVDNRPEAYPGSFFTDTLLPMQLEDDVWDRVDGLYHFNVIFFYRHDATNWGQRFMIRRLQDPQWSPVFVDDYTLIFLRRTPENAGIIEDFELPASKFRVQERS